jgi:hypothetical protein
MGDKGGVGPVVGSVGVDFKNISKTNFHGRKYPKAFLRFALEFLRENTMGFDPSLP